MPCVFLKKRRLEKQCATQKRYTYEKNNTPESAAAQILLSLKESKIFVIRVREKFVY